jgi:hypothetical protein
MNYTQLFYWLTVADNAKSLFSWVTGFSIVGLAVSVFCWIAFQSDYNEDGDKNDLLYATKSRRWFAGFLSITLTFSLLNVFTPTKKDALLIVAGGETMNFLTTDTSAKKLPAELTNFVVSELHSMAQEAKVNIDINTQREKILQSAKTMSPTDLIDKMKSDTTFAHIILNQD